MMLLLLLMLHGLYLATYKYCRKTQEIGKYNNCSNSSCVPQPVDNEDEDILENWDDDVAGGTNLRVPNSDDSDDEVLL
jgi:hypothetical protein